MNGKKISAFRLAWGMAAAVVLLAAGLALLLPLRARAGLVDWDAIREDQAQKTTQAIILPDFTGKLSGKQGYISCMDNYHLDMEETKITEGTYFLANQFANGILFLVCWIGKVTSVIYYYCMVFDIAEMFQKQIDTVQAALNSGIFRPMAIIGIGGAGVYMIKNLLKRNTVGIFLQITKVISIMVLSILLVSYSGEVLSKATGITKAISAQILLGMQGDGGAVDEKDYAISAVGVIWYNMVHLPWEFVEFGGTFPDDDDVDELLHMDATDEERYDIMDHYNSHIFSKERAWERFFFMLIYLVPCLIKCVIFIVLAVLSLGFQVFAILYVLMAPVILIMVMFPGYESMLTAWLKKLLETQMGVLIMSFVQGLIVLVDNVLYRECARVWGWLVVLVIQTVISLVIIFKRNEILAAIGKLQKGASNSGYARALVANSASNGALAEKNFVVNSARTTRKAARGIKRVMTPVVRKVSPAFEKAAGATAGAVSSAAGAAASFASGITKVAFTAGKETRKARFMEDAVNYGSKVAEERGSFKAAREEREKQETKEKKVKRPVMEESKIIPTRTVDGRLEKIAPEERAEVHQHPRKELMGSWIRKNSKPMYLAPNFSKQTEPGKVRVVSHKIRKRRLDDLPMLTPDSGKTEKGNAALKEKQSVTAEQKKPTASRKQPTAGKKRYTTDRKQYADNRKQYKSDGKQQAANQKWYTTDGKQQAADRKRYKSDGKQQAANRRRYTTDGKQQAANRKRYTADGKQQAANRKRYKATGKQYTAGRKRYSAANKRY